MGGDDGSTNVLHGCYGAGEGSVVSPPPLPLRPLRPSPLRDQALSHPLRPPPPACSHDLSPSLTCLTQMSLLDLSHNSLALGEWVSVFRWEIGRVFGPEGRANLVQLLVLHSLSAALNLADTVPPPHTHTPHTKVSTLAALPALEHLSLIGNPISTGPR